MLKALKRIFTCGSSKKKSEKSLSKSIDNIRLILMTIKKTCYKEHLYIIPSLWLTNVLEIIQNSKSSSSLNLIKIENNCFIKKINNSLCLKKKISKNEIVFVYREFILRIIENFNIDYIIQVEFSSYEKSVSLKDGVNVFTTKQFKSFSLPQNDPTPIDCLYYFSYQLVFDNYSFLSINKNIEKSFNLEQKIAELDNNISNINNDKNEEDEKRKETKNMENNNNIKNNDKNEEDENERKNNNSNENNEKNKFTSHGANNYFQINDKNSKNSENNSDNVKKRNKKKEKIEFNNNNDFQDKDLPSTDEKTPKLVDTEISNERVRKSVYDKKAFKLTNLYEHNSLNLPPRGLINPSVYCFMNTCLQCLLSIPELNYYFKHKEYIQDQKTSKRIKACSSFKELIDDYEYPNGEALSPPNTVYKICHKFLESDVQHDCQEFLRGYLERMMDELDYNKKYRFPDKVTMEKAWSQYREVYPSFIDSVFTGLLTNKVICSKCGHISYTYDPFLDLSVSFNNSDEDNLDSVLGTYFSKEKIDTDYKCEKCKAKTNIIKKLEISILPPILTIQFKRFKGTYRKINTDILFDHNLDLKNYISEESVSGNTNYSLFAVAVHLGGSIGSGHYIAFVKRKNYWYKCNDEQIRQVHKSEALSKNAYLLFYRQNQ